MPRFNTHMTNNVSNNAYNNNAPAYKNVLNPLANEDEYNNNSMSYNTNNINMNNNNHQVFEDNHSTMAQLRAASHVSMEGSPAAHEYNPTCTCADCQYLLKNFTNYSTLDDYTAIHLKFEAEQHQKYGRVPCVDGFYSEYGYAPVYAGVNDAQTGEPVYETKYGILTSAYLFHTHLHHMTPITAEVRNRSYDRFVTHRHSTTAASPNNNSHHNNNSLALPAPRHHRNHNTNNAYVTPSSSTMKKPSYVAAPAYNYSNYAPIAATATTTAAAVAPVYHYNATQHCATVSYSERDINQAKRDVAFCGVASLGGF